MRYIRDWLNGSTSNTGNHWVEIEAYGSKTTAFVGNSYEWTGSTTTQIKYYYAGSQRVAQRTGTSTDSTGLVWLLGDHLGSTAITAKGSDGSKLSEIRYKPWGEVRYVWSTTSTSYRYTGQKLAGTGLYDYGARWYDPLLGRFTSPDTIIPQGQGVQGWDRYGYSYGNPVKYKDPTGHAACIDTECSLVQHPVSQKPFIKNPSKLPEVVAYIYNEMKKNASSSITSAMSIGNAIYHYGPPGFQSIGLEISWGLWTSQVMDASVKKYAGPLSPYVGNWDHKPIVYPMNTTSFRSDIWSNIHYGYVGAAAGFTQLELTGGAGIEQIGSDVFRGSTPVFTPGADNWAANWDDPSDHVAIQLGISLWNQSGSSFSLADFYYSILSTPGLVLNH